MSAPTEGSLVRLNESTMTVADPRADVRGRSVVDAGGEDIGKVDDLLVDEGEARVRFLNVEHGGFLGIGAEHFLVPVEAVAEVTEDLVRVDRDRERLNEAPGYDPDVTDLADYYDDVYGWWGYPAYWAPGYVYPAFPY